MFFSPMHSSRQGRASAHAYQSVAVESRTADADPHQLVSMLFDGFFESVSKARGALRQGDIPAKGQAIGRAVRIIDEGLRGALDLKQGGPLARDLHDLYEYVTLRLTEANLSNNEALLDECVALVQPLCEAWASIRPQLATTPRAPGA
jgi:flagellar secretion chaperone FliS